jgi:predicted nucleic acid binding AN1-type Zn finger protein
MDTKKEYCSLATCNVKLRLTDFYCRCNKRFCAQHRVCEFHDCQFKLKLDLVKTADEMRCVKTKIEVI